MTRTQGQCDLLPPARHAASGTVTSRSRILSRNLLGHAIDSACSSFMLRVAGSGFFFFLFIAKKLLKGSTSLKRTPKL